MGNSANTQLYMNSVSKDLNDRIKLNGTKTSELINQKMEKLEYRVSKLEISIDKLNIATGIINDNLDLD